MGLPIKLPDMSGIISAVANGTLGPLVNGAGALMNGAGVLMTRVAEDVDFGKLTDAAIKVVTPANAVKAVGTTGGAAVGYVGGATLGTALGFALGGPVGAGLGYGIGMLSGAGGGAVVGFKAGQAVTHALESPENPPDITVSRDKNSKVIDAEHYSVLDDEEDN